MIGRYESVATRLSRRVLTRSSRDGTNKTRVLLHASMSCYVFTCVRQTTRGIEERIDGRQGETIGILIGLDPMSYVINYSVRVIGILEGLVAL